jgi:hypothetical protein
MTHLREQWKIMGLMSVDITNRMRFISVKINILPLFRLGIITLFLVWGSILVSHNIGIGLLVLILLVLGILFSLALVIFSLF